MTATLACLCGTQRERAQIIRIDQEEALRRGEGHGTERWLYLFESFALFLVTSSSLKVKLGWATLGGRFCSAAEGEARRGEASQEEHLIIVY